MSTDPLQEKYPNISSYAYTAQNPIKYIDPNGEDIVIAGENNSSITIATDLIDVNINAGSLLGDFGGNYNLAGTDVLIATLDIVGIFDPTGIADVAAATLEASEGNWGSAALSGLGVIPYVGDLGKLAKVGKHAKTINKAIDAADQATKMEKLRGTAKTGQEAHRQIQKGLKESGSKIEVPMKVGGKNVRKDAVKPDGTSIIIKPNTPSGRQSATRREKLMNDNNHKTETIFYNPKDPKFQPGSSTYIGPKTPKTN